MHKSIGRIAFMMLPFLARKFKCLLQKRAASNKNLRQKLQFCSGMNIKSFIEGCVSFQASEPTELENPGRNFLSAIKQAGRLQVKDLPEGVSLVKTVVKMK